MQKKLKKIQLLLNSTFSVSKGLCIYCKALKKFPCPHQGAVSGQLLLCYLCTLAPAPPIMASTSFLLAMVVSPGVVIASAPWAAP